MKPTKQAKPVKAWTMQWGSGTLSLEMYPTRHHARSRYAEYVAYCGCKIVRVEIRVIGGKK